LVATFATRATAEDPDDLSVLATADEPTDLANQPPGNQPSGQPAATQGEPSNAHTASVAPPVPDQPAGVVAQAERSGQPVQVTGQQLTDQSEQDEQPSGPTGGCLDGPCSQQPPTPGDPIVQAAAEGGGFLGPLWRALARLRGQQPPLPPQAAPPLPEGAPVPPPQQATQPPQEAQPPFQLPSLDDIQRDLDLVQRVQAERVQQDRLPDVGAFETEWARLSRATQHLERWEALEELARQGIGSGIDVEDSNRVASLRARYRAANAQYWQDQRLLPDTGPDVAGAVVRVRDSLQRVETALNNARRARSQDQPTGYQTGTRDPATDQGLLDQARRDLEQARPPTEGPPTQAGADPHYSDRLAELHHWIEELQQRLDYETGNPGSAMISTQVAPPLTPRQQSQDQRPVVILPPADSGGANPNTGIPPTLAADLQALGIPDLSDRPQPGTVVKPVPPSQQTPPQGALTTERSPLQQAAVDGLRNTVITVTSLGGLTLLLYQLGYLAVGGMMYLPGSRPPWAPATPTQG